MKVAISFDTLTDIVELAVEVGTVVTRRRLAGYLIRESLGDHVLVAALRELATALGGCVHGQRLVCHAFGELIVHTMRLVGEAPARGSWLKQVN